MRKLLVLPVAVLLCTAVSETQCGSGKRRKSKKTEPVEELKGPFDYRVWDRDLVAENVLYHKILKHAGAYYSGTNERQLEQPVLGYVTPWNSKGYDVAVTFRCKFTHISPVWHQLRSSDSGLEIAGGHDVDAEWMEKLRQPCDQGHVVRIVPRFMPELTSQASLWAMLSQPHAAAEMMVKEMRSRGYDGMVFDGLASWAYYGLLKHEEPKHLIDNLLQAIREEMDAVGKDKGGSKLELILAIPPVVPAAGADPVIGLDNLMEWSALCDGFSYMTYDYSTPHHPGANAPGKWVEENLKALGLVAHKDSVQDSFRPTPSTQLDAVDVEDDVITEESSAGETTSEAQECSSSLVDGGTCSDDGGGVRLPSSSSVLMGLNFYGAEFQVGGTGFRHLLGHEFMSVLRQYTPAVRWDKGAQEHWVQYKREGSTYHVWFPSLQSIWNRLQLAKQYKVGISIWELGQGLEYFYDLL